jgi:hypothetical protein
MHDGFLRVPLFSSNNKTDRHDITEILLKVALSIRTPFVNQDALKFQKWLQRLQWF